MFSQWYQSKDLKKIALFLLGFNVILSLLFYLLVRPNIVLFGLFNLKIKPTYTFSNSIIANSLPSFLSSAIIFTLMWVFLEKYFKLRFINKFVIATGILSECSQLLFSSRATFDFWDLVFSVAGSLMMFIILGRFKSANEVC